MKRYIRIRLCMQNNWFLNLQLTMMQLGSILLDEYFSHKSVNDSFSRDNIRMRYIRIIYND